MLRLPWDIYPLQISVKVLCDRSCISEKEKGRTLKENGSCNHRMLEGNAFSSGGKKKMNAIASEALSL